MRNAGGETRDFAVDLSDPQYETIQNQWGDMMLRNHVYTLAITSVRFGVELQLTATVADWEDAEFNLDYSETVSTTDNGKIDWYNGTFYSETFTEDTGLGELIVLPWAYNEEAQEYRPVAARCSFGLSSPVGALWVASLITTQGETSAFRFLTEAGEQVETIQGRIDANQTQLNTLSIVPTIEHPTVNSSARLQIMVSVNGGERWVEATTPDILGQWTIVQTQE